MQKKNPITKTNLFEKEVREGLSAFPKYLSSKYFYDAHGDRLFQKIMDMPEYYLTDCEFEILDRHQEAIAKYFGAKGGFDFIELGAGDGKKTKILLRYLTKNKYNFHYLPVDISLNILQDLQQSLIKEFPGIKMTSLQGTYFGVLNKIADYSKRKKVIMVLGSNIGNLMHAEAIDFLKNICVAMRSGDMLFMGFDQKKNPQTILDAYNDAAGITEAFNKNILVRINRELGGNFNPENYLHWETYNPETGTAKSFLVSKKAQQVKIAKLDLTVDFKEWESIHVEISQKYDDDVVEWLAGQAGLKIVESFTDDRGYYKNYVFQRKF